MKLSKKNISIILNLAIVILEIIGFIVTINLNGKISVKFYTEDSNLLALFASSIFVGFLLLKKEMPKWVKYLKYITTICLTVTFLVVIFVLAPMYDFDYMGLLFGDALLVQHTLAPIISFITFIFFDGISIDSVKENFIGISLTILYALILVPLNILKLLVGPYPFLEIYNQSIFASLFWTVAILGLAYLIGYILRVLQKKFNK